MVIIISASAFAVDITHFSVPQFVNRKDEVTLECHFKMSSPHETLHSVKWYRIDHTGAMEDFFTFIPANNPPVKTHSRSGIKVDVRQPFLCSFQGKNSVSVVSFSETRLKVSIYRARRNRQKFNKIQKATNLKNRAN